MGSRIFKFAIAEKGLIQAAFCYGKYPVIFKVQHAIIHIFRFPVNFKKRLCKASMLHGGPEGNRTPIPRVQGGSSTTKLRAHEGSRKTFESIKRKSKTVYQKKEINPEKSGFCVFVSAPLSGSADTENSVPTLIQARSWRGNIII